MASKNPLKKAIQQMSEGSKSGFYSFYLSSIQCVYRNALLLCHTSEEARTFVIDFYQYLYLHLPEYDKQQSLETWISSLMVERHRQLSIGKETQPLSVQQQMNAGSILISPDDQEYVWHMLEHAIHFPSEAGYQTKSEGRNPRYLLILLPGILLLLLLAVRYTPDKITMLLEAFHHNTENSSTEAPADAAAESNQSNEQPLSDLEIIQSELERLQNNQQTTDASGAEITENSGNTQPTQEPSSPQSPSTPQTPAKPQTPQTPSTPQTSDNSSNSVSGLSGSDDLSDLELKLRYGDSLLFTDSN